MFLRLVLSLIIVVFGIASPWLVQDWLALQSSNRAHTLATTPVGRSSFAKGDQAGSDTGSEVKRNSKNAPVTHSRGLTRGPYPLASATLRFFQGLVPRPFSPIPAQSGPFSAAGSIPGSALAAATVSRVRPRLDSSLKRLGLKTGSPIFIRIFKEERELELWVKARGSSHYSLFKIYKIEAWSGKIGPKLKEGDRQTPEGFYFVSSSRLRPSTRHHLGLDIGYPNSYDKYHGRSGSDMTIHGSGPSFGSFSLPDSSMEEVYTLAEGALRGGQKFFRVNIFPFRMTDRRMDRVWKSQPQWVKFWVNLKEGYDFFENAGFPPDVNVKGGKYVFAAK